MRLKGYYEFLLESILLTSDGLADIIKSIDDPIAQKFHGLINKDVKTKFNIVNLTDTNDKLSFIPDSQATTKIKSGIDPSDLFNDKVNQTTIGRVVRGILTDNSIPYTDREIEKFVNKFKAAYDSSNKENEIGMVDELLGKFGTTFDSRNQIYKLGIKQFDALWKSAMSEYFEDCFNYAYSYQASYRSMQRLQSK